MPCARLSRPVPHVSYLWFNGRPSFPWEPPTFSAAIQGGMEGGQGLGEGWRLPQSGTNTQLERSVLATLKLFYLLLNPL